MRKKKRGLNITVTTNGKPSEEAMLNFLKVYHKMCDKYNL